MSASQTTSKKCRGKCGEKRPIAYFCRDKSKSDGRRHECRMCRRERRAELERGTERRRGIKDYSDKRFGTLVAVRRIGSDQKGQSIWLMRCDCGGFEERLMTRFSEVKGNTSTCSSCRQKNAQGRRNREALKTVFGIGRKRRRNTGSQHWPLYGIWRGMIARCHNPRDKSFAGYGAKGVQVCARWRDSYRAFESDMGPRPSKRHSLDRADTFGDYTPENCRWATPAEQSRNNRRAILITLNGETKPLAEWLEGSEVPYSTAYARLRKGWAPTVALFKPARRKAAA